MSSAASSSAPALTSLWTAQTGGAPLNTGSANPRRHSGPSGQRIAWTRQGSSRRLEVTVVRVVLGHRHAPREVAGPRLP
jgi:hypothetical protein